MIRNNIVDINEYVNYEFIVIPIWSNCLITKVKKQNSCYWTKK